MVVMMMMMMMTTMTMMMMMMMMRGATGDVRRTATMITPPTFLDWQVARHFKASSCCVPRVRCCLHFFASGGPFESGCLLGRPRLFEPGGPSTLSGVPVVVAGILALALAGVLLVPASCVFCLRRGPSPPWGRPRFPGPACGLCS